MAETQLVDELPIAFQVGALQILQQAAALADHLQEPALPVEILRVDPEVIGKAVDPLGEQRDLDRGRPRVDRKSTRLNSSHLVISYAVFCLKKKKKQNDSVT